MANLRVPAPVVSPERLHENLERPNLTVILEGLPPQDLCARLNNAGIQLNSHAQTLLQAEYFDFTKTGTYRIQLVTVAELGFTTPATLPEIYSRSQGRGFDLCPLELAPYFRLAWQTQAESNNSVITGQHRSPDSAVIVASPVLSADPYVPKGFYLRHVDGTLWLRGYISDDEHQNELDVTFAFVVN